MEDEEFTHYQQYIKRKILIIGGSGIAVLLLFFISVSVGAVSIPLGEVFSTIWNGSGTSLYERIIWNIRIPQTLTAIAVGAGLAIAGAVMQSILRNPLASPFTLGISNAAAFGAAVGILLFDAGIQANSATGAVVISNPYTTTVCAFAFSMLTAVIILMIAKTRSANPEVMILSGVALSSLFSAGIMAIQYFVDDTKLSSIVFWQFGDVSRATWEQLGLIALVTAVCIGYFMMKRWDLNAIDAGDETAKSLGVNVSRTRIAGMIAASLISAIVVSFLGVIGFVGLVCPHVMRRLIGDDNRFLLPGTAVCGALLLLLSDMAARLVIAPQILPVAVITAFLGTPVFLYLIIKRRSA